MKMKKILSVSLAVAMVVSVTPGSVWATEEESPEVVFDAEELTEDCELSSEGQDAEIFSDDTDSQGVDIEINDEEEEDASLDLTEGTKVEEVPDVGLNADVTAPVIDVASLKVNRKEAVAGGKSYV